MENNKRTASNNGRQYAFFRYLLVGHEKAPSVLFAFVTWNGNPRWRSVSGASGGGRVFSGGHDVPCYLGFAELPSGAAVLSAGEGRKPATVLFQEPSKQRHSCGEYRWNRRTASCKVT